MGGSKAGFYQMSPEPPAPEGLVHEQGEVYLDDFLVFHKPDKFHTS